MRKEIEITIEDGRDTGKVFKIVEMGAVQADRWATKALCLFGRAGQNISALGKMNIVDLLSAFSSVQYEEAQPLLDELLACASFKKDGVYVNLKGSMVDATIEEWTTLFRLRVEALKLILGFLEQGGESGSK